MAEASILVDQDQFSCPVCLDLLKDPVTTSCGHSFCMVCINDCWDQYDQRGVYSCPQCRETFSPRPVLRRNNMLAEVVEKVKKTELQAPTPAHCSAGPEDVECDVCTGRKLKAIKSCLVCLASFCEDHLQPHYQAPAFKTHKLVNVSKQLKEKICSQHNKLIEIYCHTDQQFICYMCTMHEHRSHSTVAAAAERKEKEIQLKDMQKKSQQKIQSKEKKLQELKQSVKTTKSSAQSAVEHSEGIFSELISSIEKKCSEVTELIRAQEKAELSQAEELKKTLEEEITDLKTRNSELEQLSHTEDHIQFLQTFQSLCVSSASDDSTCSTVHLSFDEVRKSLSGLKERLEEFCKQELRTIFPPAAAVQMILPSKDPRTREDCLQYFHQLILDPNTVHKNLILSENNTVVKFCQTDQHYSYHPERFDSWSQVLCKESLSGHCYWEVEWSSEGRMFLSVLYKTISRKGQGTECWFGHNDHSWSLQCSSHCLSFWHNNIETKLSAPSSSKIGVYVDHSAGILSFYSISDTMTLLHTVHTTFTQPLYAGFWVGWATTVKLCDAK